MPIPAVPIPALPSRPVDEEFDISVDEVEDPWGDPGQKVASSGIAMDTVQRMHGQGTAPAARPEESDPFDTLLLGYDELWALNDFSGALELAEKALGMRPGDQDTLDKIGRAQNKLLAMYEAKLGAITRRPRVRVNPSEIIWLNLDHRAGFVLSLIDGLSTYDEVLALSGMPRFDTCRILAKLLEERVIESV